MKTRSYQVALVATVVVCFALAATLTYILWRRNPAAPNLAAEDPVIARGPVMASQPMPSAAPAAAGADPGLAPMQLSPQRMQAIGVTMATVQLKVVNDDLNVPGNVDIDEEKLSYVQTRFPGWIQDVFANATYQYVRKGQHLFTIYSPDLISSEQEYLLARQNQKTFAPNANDIAAREGGWLLQAADERLRQFDIPAETIRNLEQTGQVQRNILIDSPVSGYIIERNALPNAYVQPGTKLYTIADLSTIWVYANVFQDDVGRLKPGDSAQITVDAYPGRNFNGHINQVLPQVDSTTRTVRVRLVFPNPGVVLKPGMFVNVAIAVPLGRQLVVPASALLQAGSRSIAFVDHGNGNLEPRAVETGPQLYDSVVVLKGLKAGERVVSSANFLVDSEAQLQQALGAFTPSAQAAAAPPNSPSATRMQIDLTTRPSPPSRGANTVQVKLIGPDGKPVTGMQVHATFFMPAMPAMGMAAEREVATLTDKGGGIYQGTLQLESGGTFQVSVTVQHDGQTVAAKQLSVTAAGGM